MPTYPSEKYAESSVGMMTFPTEWKVKKIHGCKPPTRNTSRVILFWPSDGGQNAWQNMHEDALGFCDKICKAKTMLRHHLCQRKCIGSTYTEQDVHAFFLAVYDLSAKISMAKQAVRMSYVTWSVVVTSGTVSRKRGASHPWFIQLAHAGTKLVIKERLYS